VDPCDSGQRYGPPPPEASGRPPRRPVAESRRPLANAPAG